LGVPLLELTAPPTRIYEAGLFSVVRQPFRWSLNVLLNVRAVSWRIIDVIQRQSERRDLVFGDGRSGGERLTKQP